MFGKNKDREHPHNEHDKEGAEYTVESENLAVPEVHTGKVEHKEIIDDETDSGAEVDISFDTAIPEIHIHKKKKD